ncbi:MAG: DUF3526 domain-containing protein [Proteobacteria bacterium]|nr:DUF3526 domain-containing protein [Pseudomonadota bacterium]
MKRAILYLESLNFIARGPALIATAIIVVTIGYAGWSGDRWRDAKRSGLESFEAEKLDALAKWRDGLVQIENGTRQAKPRDANPMSISFPAVLPPSSLGDFAIGHADLHPDSAEISPWRNPSSMFGRYQFDNPTTLASSRFDVVVVIILLLPLLMIAVSFDVLAGDRARGALSMVLSFPIRLTSLAWSRLLVRNGLLWVTAVLVMTCLLLLNDAGGDRYARFGLWLGVCLAYGLFWLTVIALCVAYIPTAINTAAALVAVWMVLALALPATVTTISEAAFPTPSRLAYLSEIRRAQTETNRELDRLTAKYLIDHPELTVGNEELPSFYRAAFISNQIARDRTRPILEAYEAARAGRAQTLRWAQYLSPSIIAQRLLNFTADADLDRQHRFQAQARDALEQLSVAVGPAVVSRNRLSAAEFDTLSLFSFQERSLAELAWLAAVPMAFLLLSSALLAVVAHRRLGAIRLHD